MRFRSIGGVIGALMFSLLATGTAMANLGTCADIAGGVTLEAGAELYAATFSQFLGIDLSAGDTLVLQVDVTAYNSSIDLNFSLDDAGPNLGRGSYSGPGTSWTVDVPIASDYPSGQLLLSVYSYNPGTEADVSISCIPAGSGGSSGTPIDYIQNGVLKHATINATQMINDLVDGGVDAAFSAQADKSAGSLGFTSGGIVVDATPDALKGSPLAIWSGVRYGLTPGDANNWSGMQVSGAAGVNYSASDALVLGLFGAYEANGYNLKANSQSFTGSGPTAGLVAAYRLGDNWRIEATGYASLLGYSIDDSGTTGKFGAVRYVLKGTLSGATPLNANIDFVPMASLSIVRQDDAAYVDSAAASHAAQTVLAGQGSAGGKFVFYPTDGLVTFWAGGYGDYWLGDAFGGGLSGRIEAGTDIGFGDTGKVGFKVEASHIDTIATTYAASATVGGAL